MTQPTPPRRRLVSFGEIIALAALIVSALGLWLTWKNMQKSGPTEIVEKKRAIPLVLRGSVDRDGETLAITPVESSHALESLTLNAPGKTPIETGSDGALSNDSIEGLVDRKERKDSGSIRVRIAARYVEMGQERTSSATYSIRYRWQGGGLFEGRRLKLAGFSRG